MRSPRAPGSRPPPTTARQLRTLQRLARPGTSLSHHLKLHLGKTERRARELRSAQRGKAAGGVQAVMHSAVPSPLASPRPVAVAEANGGGPEAAQWKGLQKRRRQAAGEEGAAQGGRAGGGQQQQEGEGEGEGLHNGRLGSHGLASTSTGAGAGAGQAEAHGRSRGPHKKGRLAGAWPGGVGPGAGGASEQNGGGGEQVLVGAEAARLLGAGGAQGGSARGLQPWDGAGAGAAAQRGPLLGLPAQKRSRCVRRGVRLPPAARAAACMCRGVRCSHAPTPQALTCTRIRALAVHAGSWMSGTLSTMRGA